MRPTRFCDSSRRALIDSMISEHGPKANRVQRVFVLPHDPRWADEFTGGSFVVAGALGELLQVSHHIGSTAIPGICAKPIIDMLVVVSDLAVLDERTARMEALGYEALGEFGIAGRRYFRKDGQDGNRTH